MTQAGSVIKLSSSSLAHEVVNFADEIAAELDVEFIQHANTWLSATLGPLIKRIEISGSAARGTAIKDRSDMDFLLVIADDVAFATPENVESVVAKIYHQIITHNASVFLQRHSLNISVSHDDFGGDSDVEFDLVLAQDQKDTHDLQIFQVNYLYKALDTVFPVSN